jgi:hypothetical protein
MEPYGSLPRAHESFTGSYPELDPSNPYHPIMSKIHLNILFPSTFVFLEVSFLLAPFLLSKAAVSCLNPQEWTPPMQQSGLEASYFPRTHCLRVVIKAQENRHQECFTSQWPESASETWNLFGISHREDELQWGVCLFVCLFRAMVLAFCVTTFPHLQWFLTLSLSILLQLYVRRPLSAKSWHQLRRQAAVARSV